MWRIRLVLLLLSGLLTHTASADSLSLQIEHSIAAMGEVEGLQAELGFSTQGLALTVSAERLHLPEPVGEVSQLSFDCPNLRLYSEQFRCEAGQLAFTHATLGTQQLTVQRLHASNQFSTLSLAFAGLQWADGVWSVAADWQEGRWQAAVNVKAVDIKKLQTILKVFEPDWLPVLDMQGQVDLKAILEGRDRQLHSIDSEIDLQSVAFSDTAGALAAENIAGDFQIAASLGESGWQWRQQGTLDSGELYVAPVYLNIGAHPLSLLSQGHWQPETDQVTVSRWQFQQQDVMQADGEATLDDYQLSSLQADLVSTNLQMLYQSWLQPFVFDTAADDAQLQGEAQLSLVWQDSGYDLRAQLADISLIDNQQRFNISGLTGNVAWTNQDQILPIDLSWQSAGLYQIDLGAARLQATALKNQLTLSERLSLPVLDGELVLDAFQLFYPPEASVSWSFEGLLKPVSMPVLSEALGWPLLQGKLSGVIPAVRYENRQVDVDGALMVKIFDGTTIIRDLQLSEPFGYTPHLRANVDINQLDLETLTTAFDFGRISGTLNGYLRDLQLSDWRPIQFDAWLATDENADTPRRISQRAVNNLSQLGGGPGGLLSRSFLRFFDDFSYQRLGIGCRLSRSICEMRGVSDAEAGYYIVEGGGLPPWINVIGYNRQVDWPVLIDRLQAVSQSDGPVIQ